MEKEAARILDTDRLEFFDGLNGTAVIYAPEWGEYHTFREDAVFVRRLPCSTFKIASSLIAMGEGGSY